jgi:hypothetical protein
VSVPGSTIEKPIRGEVASKLEHLRVKRQSCSRMRLARRVRSCCRSSAIRDHSQLHNHWFVVRQAPKGVPIGAQAVGQHVSVAPVILGAGHGEAVAEPIELLGIDLY